MLQPVTLTDVPVSQQFANNPAYYQRVAGTPGHNGLDLAVPVGTQLYAPVDGIILEIDYDGPGWGFYCKIGTVDAGHFLLAHLSSFAGTRVGDSVVRGTPICLSGNTGNSTGPHVHVGWRPCGSYRATLYRGWADPEGFLYLLNSYPQWPVPTA